MMTAGTGQLKRILITKLAAWAASATGGGFTPQPTPFAKRRPSPVKLPITRNAIGLPSKPGGLVPQPRRPVDLTGNSPLQRKHHFYPAVFPPRRRVTGGEYEAHALRAAKEHKLPTSWATNKDIKSISHGEGGGWTGRPNYTYTERKHDPLPAGSTSGTGKGRHHWPGVWAELRRGESKAKSTATGYGQLTRPNVERYHPQGVRGIGDPYNEIAGMLRYLKGRYGTPEKAKAFKDKHGWW